MNDLNFNPNLPILGQQKTRAQVGPPLALIRALDENATFEPESVVNMGGQPVAIAGRQNIVTAEDLVDMLVEDLTPVIRRIVKEVLDSSSK